VSLPERGDNRGAIRLEDRGRSIYSLFTIFIKELTLLGMGTFVLLDEKNDTKERIYIFIRIFVEYSLVETLCL
jgi:hypothetical protein